jgi:hypothetical protein
LLGLIFLQIWYNIHFNELCKLITTSVLDKKFDCLDPDKLPILIQDIFTKYLENSANRENLVILKYMLTSVEQRKSARDIIYYFSCIE